jgi:Cu+-exporting ATPase
MWNSTVQTEGVRPCTTCGNVLGRESRARRREVQRVELSVSGISCAGATAQLASRVARLPGVHEATVNAVTERATIRFDSGVVGVEGIVRSIERDVGMDVSDGPAYWRLPLGGPVCGSCIRRLKDAVQSVPGVHRATVSVAVDSLTIEFTPSNTDVAELRTTMWRAGFDIEVSPSV